MEKKKKLTLTISSNRQYKTDNYLERQKKTSVVIEKRVARKRGDKKFYDRNQTLGRSGQEFSNKKICDRAIVLPQKK